MKTKLTPAFVKRATAAAGAERTVYWDASLPGFGLMVTPAGHRSYIAQYRAGGRSRRATIGGVGVLGLDAARREAKGILGAVAKGRDPVAERRQEAAAIADTFKAVASDYLDREGRRLRTANDRQRILERLVYPKFGARPIASIKRSELVRLLDKIEDQNGARMADLTLAIVRRVFNWHASRADDFLSPVRRGMARQKPKEQARQRILTDAELRAIWQAAEQGGGVFDRYVRFLMLTATRRAEAADMTRDELTGSDWLIPASRYKTKQEHLVPLSPDALAVLAELPALGPFVFSTDGRRAIGGFSKFKRDFDERCGVADWRLHDLRRTARSLMSRAGVPTDHAERALGHVMGGVRGVYDRHEYGEEKRVAFEALALQIRRILNPADNVRPLREAVA